MTDVAGDVRTFIEILGREDTLPFYFEFETADAVYIYNLTLMQMMEQELGKLIEGSEEVASLQRTVLGNFFQEIFGGYGSGVHGLRKTETVIIAGDIL